jgi:outer membrane protein OmpA-like peptidoglycan-associated protein
VAGAASTIDRLADFLRENSERRIRIEGYADARGAESYNLDLSSRRARAVQDVLAARGGFDNDRIQAIGLGESYPIASNETQAGMQQNRRVEIVFSDSEGAFSDAALERTARLN